MIFPTTDLQDEAGTKMEVPLGLSRRTRAEKMDMSQILQICFRILALDFSICDKSFSYRLKKNFDLTAR